MTVRALKWAKALIVLLTLYGAQAAWSCPDDRAWKDFSAVTLSMPDASLLTMKRFTDGVHLQRDDGSGTREMYQLDKGVVLYKGFSPEKLKGPSPFFMANMPASMAIDLLAWRFKSPCDIESRDTKVDYKVSSESVKVTGSVRRTEMSSVVFDLVGVESRKQGATIKLAGHFDFSVLTPIPKDLPLAGWIQVRGDGMTTEQSILVLQATDTLDALAARPLETKKP